MNATELQHHIQLKAGDVGRYVLLPGDPGRCEPIARLFDDSVKVASNREYETWTGTLDGEKVSVVSTGIGCPSASIAVEELIKIGADTFIHVNTEAAGLVTVRASGDFPVQHGETVYLTPDPARIHKFDAQGKAIR